MVSWCKPRSAREDWHCGVDLTQPCSTHLLQTGQTLPEGPAWLVQAHRALGVKSPVADTPEVAVPSPAALAFPPSLQNSCPSPSQQPEEPHWLLASPKAPGAGAPETQGEWEAGSDPGKCKPGSTDPQENLRNHQEPSAGAKPELKPCCVQITALEGTLLAGTAVPRAIAVTSINPTARGRSSPTGTAAFPPTPATSSTPRQITQTQTDGTLRENTSPNPPLNPQL